MNAIELLKEARAELAKAHDHLMELTAKLPMQYFGLVDGNIIQSEDCFVDKIDAYLAAPSDKCPRCDGKGWTAEHSTDANAHDEEGNCNPGYCPVQVQCEVCNGTGLAAPSESAMEVLRKIRERKNYASQYDDIGNLLCPRSESDYVLTDTEAAALIEGMWRRVPDDYLREERELLAAKDEYIALLEKASGEGALFAFVHGAHVPQCDIDAGIRCRAKIAEIAAKHGVEVEN